MKTIKNILLSDTMKRFYWNNLAGFLAALAVVISGIDWIYAIPLAAVLNGISKEINNRYFD